MPNNSDEVSVPLPITHKKVLLVEGKTPYVFFGALLKHLGLQEAIETRNYGGVGDFSAALRALIATSGFGDVNAIGIVRDAETDANAAFHSVRDCLNAAGLPSPSHPIEITNSHPYVSVFILPDCENPGMLESLCLQSVSNDPTIPCVAEYIECIERQGYPPKNMDKARVHTFLASRERPGLLVGQAAFAGYWPWDSPTYDKIKAFLLHL